MKKRGEPVRVNDVIAYVITGDGQDYNKNVAERAYSPQDVSKTGSELQIGMLGFEKRAYYQIIVITLRNRFFLRLNDYALPSIVPIQQGLRNVLV